MANLAGQKDFQTLYQEVALEVIDTATASESTDPSLVYFKQRLNDAYRELVTEFPMWFKYAKYTPATTASTANLVLDDEIARVESIMIPTSQITMRDVTREEFNSFLPGGLTNTGPGIPTQWIAGVAASNNALTVDLFPVPDKEYTLEVWAERRFVDLTNDTDIPVIPPEWQDVLLNKAKMYCYLKINDPKAQDFRELYEERYEKMWLAYEQHLGSAPGWRDATLERGQFSYPGLYFPYIAGYGE